MTLRHLFPLWFTLYLTVLRTGTISLHIFIVCFCLYSLELIFACCTDVSLSLALFFTHTEHIIITNSALLFVYLHQGSRERTQIRVQLFSCFVYFCLIVALKVTGSSCVTTQTQTQNETSTCRIVLLLQSNGDLYLWLIILSVPLSTLTTG